MLVQWPLRCIRWYECSGRGRFAIETGSHASTGSGRYVFKTRVSQDSAIFDQIDTLVNEQAKMQGVSLDCDLFSSDDSILSVIQNSEIAFEWKFYCLKCCSSSADFLQLVSNEFCQFNLPTHLF